MSPASFADGSPMGKEWYFQVNLPKASTMCVPVKLSGHRTPMFFGRYTVATLQPCDKSSYEYPIIIGTFDLLWGSSAFFDCFCMVPFLKTDLETLKSPWQRVRSFIFLDIVQKGSTPSTSWAVASPPPPAAAAASSSSWCQIWFYIPSISNNIPNLRPNTYFFWKKIWGGSPNWTRWGPPVISLFRILEKNVNSIVTFPNQPNREPSKKGQLSYMHHSESH